MRTVWQDVLFAIRTWRKNPGFLVTVLVILTLGIGATTTIFSVVNGALLRLFPYERLGNWPSVGKRAAIQPGMKQMGNTDF